MLAMFGQYFAIVAAASDPDNYEWEYYYYEDPIGECLLKPDGTHTMERIPLLL